ncbi:MAG: hydroxymethylglutaryl-CoA reductase, degradative, partial [Candidatus Promineifilaceae bacterium]
MSDSNGRRSSRLPGFYTRPLEERIAIVAAWAGLSPAEAAVLAGCGLSAGQANLMIENALGAFELPLGVACNFQINSRDYLVPMAIEEPSVLAAVSHAAKLVRSGGGFQTEASEPVMIGQLQLLEVSDMPAAIAAVEAHKAELLAIADEGKRTTLRLGGGARDIEARPFPDTPAGPMLILHLYADVRDAMGANAINTSLERMAPRLAELTGGRVGLRILSNLSDRRTASARCCVPAAALADRPEDGRQVARLIAEANAFALVDPYRAATHNKGIMNGIDA